mgnify:CR=1 FL=1
MFTTVYSAAVYGLQAYLVRVEVDLAGGLPTFLLVGSLGSEVKESRERVCVAMKNSGFQLPPAHITVNLAPADRRKDGTAFDLPIAVGLLRDMELVPEEVLQDTLFLGELGLNGEVKKVKGVLPIAQEAANCGIRRVVVPEENAMEAAVIPGITVWGVNCLTDLLMALIHPEEENEKIYQPRIRAEDLLQKGEASGTGDFREVAGQEAAKRGAVIAAAGFHNLLMIGPPGVGKSMIAGRIPGILPPLTLEESLEVTGIFSVAGLLPPGQALITRRPFYAPHHTVTQAALTGGGNGIPRPGIVSLAHRGVLFLDELPEFQKTVLDSMRQPMEERKVQIARSAGMVTYPSDFILVAAMNPCPCGYYPDRNKCRCTQPQIEKYLGKISGPILDRIDLCVELHPVDILHLQKTKVEKSSEDMRQQIMRARKRQAERFAGTDCRFNGDIRPARLETYCPLGEEERKVMEQLYRTLQLSARAYHRILKTARTIADLEEQENISGEHLLEAACYRPSETYWN